MRSIKDINVDESILGSVKAGKENLVNTWIENNLSNGFIITPNGHIKLSLTKEFIGVDVPVIFDEMNSEVWFKKCTMKYFCIPKIFTKIHFENCPNLERVYTPDGEPYCYGMLGGDSSKSELTFDNCTKLKDFDIDKVVVGHVSISNAPELTTLDKIKNIQSSLEVEACKKLRSCALNNELAIDIDFYRCNLKTFKNPIVARYFNMDNMLKIKDLSLNIGACDEIHITNCSHLEHFEISGQNPKALVVDNCKEMKVIDINVNPQFSTSLCNMDNLVKVNCPKRLQGNATFKRLNLTPDVKAKNIR